MRIVETKIAESFLEIIYLDNDDNARKTDVVAEFDTDEEALEEFNSWRYLSVAKGKARFMLDYYNADGDLTDTLYLDEYGFRTVTGKPVLADSEYQKIDIDFWNQARKEYFAPTPK